MEKKEEILRVRNLDISFETTAGVVNAVRGVNLTVNRGETVAIVGESGSGKSVSAKAIMGILAPMSRVCTLLAITERSTADRSHFHITVTRRNGSPEKFCR